MNCQYLASALAGVRDGGQAKVFKCDRTILPHRSAAVKSSRKRLFWRGCCQIRSHGRQSFQGVSGLIIWMLQNETEALFWN
jgi:hypothetical protein